MTGYSPTTITEELPTTQKLARPLNTRALVGTKCTVVAADVGRAASFPVRETATIRNPILPRTTVFENPIRNAYLEMRVVRTSSGLPPGASSLGAHSALRRDPLPLVCDQSVGFLLQRRPTEFVSVWKTALPQALSVTAGMTPIAYPDAKLVRKPSIPCPMAQ